MATHPYERVLSMLRDGAVNELRWARAFRHEVRCAVDGCRRWTLCGAKPHTAMRFTPVCSYCWATAQRRTEVTP